MSDVQNNSGQKELIVSDPPSPDIPGDPPAPHVPEVEQGVIPGMGETPAPSKTVIDVSAARKAAKQVEQSTPEAKADKAAHDGAPPLQRDKLELLTK